MTGQIVDVHHHIIPKIYKDELKKAGVSSAGGFPIKDWTPEDSIKMMDDLDIDVGVTSISEPGTMPLKKKHAAKVARKVNEYQAQLKRDYPGRFKSFALLPLPHVKESLKEIEYALDVLKLDGVGLYSNYGEEFLGNDKFEAVMKLLHKKDAVVFIHPSASEKGFVSPEYIPSDFIEEFTFNTTRAANNLILSGTLERYPNIDFILAHAGGVLPYLEWRIDETLKTEQYILEDPLNRVDTIMRKDKGGFIKTFLKHPIRYTKMFKNYAHILRRWSSLSQPAAYYIRKFHYDTALSTGNSTFAGIKEVTDVSHFHFGSDAHFAPDRWIAEMEKNIRETDYFDEDEKRQIFSRNAIDLLNKHNR